MKCWWKRAKRDRKKIDAAKAAASRLLEEQETVASQKAEEIVRKARQLAELEQQKEREALKEQFGQLVALAAAQVTGKMLTEETSGESTGSDRQPGFLIRFMKIGKDTLNGRPQAVPALHGREYRGGGPRAPDRPENCGTQTP